VQTKVRGYPKVTARLGPGDGWADSVTTDFSRRPYCGEVRQHRRGQRPLTKEWRLPKGLPTQPRTAYSQLGTRTHGPAVDQVLLLGTGLQCDVRQAHPPGLLLL